MPLAYPSTIYKRFGRVQIKQIFDSVNSICQIVKGVSLQRMIRQTYIVRGILRAVEGEDNLT